jgi:glyceraldehyde 3-phosphate dehydrogenase
VSVRIGINGFGRTGRALYRAILERELAIEVVAVNDLGSAEQLGRLLARDSVHGGLPVALAVGEDHIVAGRQHTSVLGEAEASRLPWGDLGVDVVVDSTGKAKNRERAAAHLSAGAHRVIVSAPCDGADATFVIGVNDHEFDPERHFVVSNASCTTNCFALMAKVLDDAFGVESGFMTTVHAYTGDQALVDGLHKDPRRGRAAALNIVPTSTGAARATGLVLPSTKGSLDGVAVRVPVADGSLTDFVAVVGRATSAAEVNACFEAAANGALAGLLEYSTDSLVSSDVVHSAASCTFDAPLTMARGSLVKTFGWYDNEWGYSNRLADLCLLVGTMTERATRGAGDRTR